MNEHALDRRLGGGALAKCTQQTYLAIAMSSTCYYNPYMALPKIAQPPGEKPFPWVKNIVDVLIGFLVAAWLYLRRSL